MVLTILNHTIGLTEKFYKFNNLKYCMGVLLKREYLNRFLEECKRFSELVAPVKRDILRFEKIDDVNDVSLEGNPMVSIKKYFLPFKEELLHIKNDDAEESWTVIDRIVFGARLCDLNALGILDNIYLEPGNEDPAYKARRERTIIIGLNCKTPPSSNCFCGSMNLQKDYDVLFQEKDKNSWFLDVRTEKGWELINRVRKKVDMQDHEEEVMMPRTKKALKEGDLWPYFDKELWQGDINQCFSCQRCTVLCPTCFCFDLNDEMDLSLDMKEGSRFRTIDSCHSQDFTRVSGGHDFRGERGQRYMHRVYHKLQSYKDRFGRSMCTGCGRCIDYCHSKIDFVGTANNLIEIGNNKIGDNK